ncbi:MBL fold metallo-hydrolase, partial [Acinetobacter baumannii]
LPLDKPVSLTGAGVGLGFTVEAFAVPGKIALYLETEGANFGSRDGDTIGLKISDDKTGESFFYIPGCAEIDAPLATRIQGAKLIFFDGTL